MNQELKDYFKADDLFKLLRKAGVKLIIDQSHNIVAKGLRDNRSVNTVVFLNQFEGSEGSRLLRQAEVLCKEFGL